MIKPIEISEEHGKVLFGGAVEQTTETVEQTSEAIDEITNTL